MRTSSAAFFPVRRSTCLILILISMSSTLSAQQNTVGLMENREGAWDGYTLFAPINSTTTYLIDMKGRLVHSWPGSTTPGMGVYLLSGGRLIRTELVSNPNFVVGGGGGRIVIRSWEGDVLWEYLYSDSLVHQHHDIEVLPNGNVLMIAWERKTRVEALMAGVDSVRAPQDGLYPDHLIELRPEGSSGGTIVWEWHAWDHLVQDVDSTRSNYGVVEEHPELINLNATLTGTDRKKPDWWHSNAVDYNAALDQILLSVRNYSEIWVIDHSTTTEEAAGHSGGRHGRGGDLLYRYGNVRIYRPGAPVLRQLVVQHDARWIKDGYPGEGNITVFSNGDLNMGLYSSVVEIAPPVDSSGRYSIGANGIFGPESIVWRYSAPHPQDFFARNISGASRLPNGNTLICNGPAGEFFEVTTEGETVWRYINPVTGDGPLAQGTPIPGSDFSSDNLVFRCTRIDPDDVRLQGKDLTPGDPIELYPTAVDEGGPANTEAAQPSRPVLAVNFPNPFNPSTTIRFTLPRAMSVSLVVTDVFGREIVRPLKKQLLTAGTHSVAFEATGFPSGVYLCRLETDDVPLVRKMVLMK